MLIKVDQALLYFIDYFLTMSNDCKEERRQYLTKKIIQFFEQSRSKSINQSDITLTSMFSLTNEVYKVSVNHEKLIVKIYHPTLPEFTDNKLQTLVVCKLAEENLYPKVEYCSHQLRIEEFIESNETTQRTLGNKKLASVIDKLARFSCGYASMVDQYNKQHGTVNKFELTNLLKIFETIYKSKKLECPSLVEQCTGQIEEVLYDKSIHSKLLKILEKTPSMLCHNDCHLGNILSSNEAAYIVDFQFCQFNAMGYDLGNFLNEWATEYSPSFQIREELEMDQKMQHEIMKIYYSELKKTYNCGEVLEDWTYFTKLGRTLSHLFWMIIGLKQINDPRIEFSMVYYVKRRKQEFLRHFKELLKLTNDF